MYLSRGLVHLFVLCLYFCKPAQIYRRNFMYYHTLIDEAIKAQGLSYIEAVEKCDLSRGTATSIKSHKPLNNTTLHKLAIKLNIPEIDPYNNTQSDNEISLLSTFRCLSPENQIALLNSAVALRHLEISGELAIPTLEIKHSIFKVSAGVGEMLTDADTWGNIVVTDTPLSRKADYALTISGDSMQPDFNNGDIVLVREQPAVNVGDICVYTLAGKGYIKKFCGDRLISLNPDYEDIMLSEYSIDDIKCNGLVLGKLQ